MEALGSYLLQMACWLACFYLVYLAVLRKETFFELNRWFLLVGLVASLTLPFFPIRYTVIKTPTDLSALHLLGKATGSETMEPASSINFWMIAYLLGILLFLFRFVWQTVKLQRLRSESEQIRLGSTRIFKLDKDTAPFSFFNSIYISKNLCGETELKTVVAHEKVHIDERHWVDLLLLEVTRALQWFNPLLILYRKAMLQNHEFLADNGTLQKGVSAHTYKAILANQMLGVPILQVANGFTLFNPTKRILMMNKDKTTPVKRFKLLWALPVIAMLLFAFAKPNYISGNGGNSTSAIANTITVKGKVINAEGKPLEGTTIIVNNTTIGTVSDANGDYKLEGIDPEAELIFSYVGYQTKVAKVKSELNVSLKRTIIGVSPYAGALAPPPPPPPPPPIGGREKINDAPPPPPPPPVLFKSKDGKKPLVVIDGKISDQDINLIDSESIESINVLKDQTATDKYGTKAKDGVVEITLKKNTDTKAVIKEPVKGPEIAGNGNESEKQPFVVVEELPQYPGGGDAMKAYLEKATGGSTGKGTVTVIFTIADDGKIKGAKVQKGVSENLDKKALEIIYGMPKWSPATQHGKAVEVTMSTEVNF